MNIQISISLCKKNGFFKFNLRQNQKIANIISISTPKIPLKRFISTFCRFL